MRVEVRDLHRGFEHNRVLRGVTLEIPQNQVTLIVGGSGCGKTVLLKHLIGLLKPDRGQVIVDGTDIARIPERRLTPNVLYARRTIPSISSARAWGSGMNSTEVMVPPAKNSL